MARGRGGLERVVRREMININYNPRTSYSSGYCTCSAKLSYSFNEIVAEHDL